MLEYDIHRNTLTNVRSRGLTVTSRKNHCAVVYHKSMIVYGGQTETGVYVNIMAVLHLDFLEWIRINLKTHMAPFICGAVCAVTLTKKQQE